MASLEIVKTFNDNYFGRIRMEQENKKMVALGYKVKNIRQIRDRNWGCCAGIIFLPIFLFKRKALEVTYERD